MTEEKSPNLQPRNRGRREDRLKAILAAALDEFGAHGFAAARLDTIAERAGISKGTIYLYFDGKEKLFEGVIRAFVVPIVERLETVSENPQLPAEALLRLQMQTLYRELVGTERRRILRLLIAEGPRFPHLVDFYFREVLQRALPAVQRTIAYGVKSGAFRATRLPDFPQALVGPAITAAIWKILFEDRKPLDLEQLFETHMDLVINGLRRG